MRIRVDALLRALSVVNIGFIFCCLRLPGLVTGQGSISNCMQPLVFMADWSVIEFLQEQKEYKALNLDQWTAFLRFCNEVGVDCILENIACDRADKMSTLKARGG